MQNENTVGNGLFQVIKGTAIALVLSLLGTVIFASVLRFTKLPDKCIYPVNQTLKVLWVSVGAFLCVRGEKGFLKGGTIGVLFTALSYLTFSSIGGDFSLSWMIVAEVALAVFAGVVFGSIAVNVKRN